MRGDTVHLEVLVEDTSGAIMLESFLEKILGTNERNHTFRVHPYKGIGRLPKDLKGKTNPAKRILLDQLPRLLRGYGRSLRQHNSAVLVIADLDDKDCKEFKQELLNILDECNPQPRVKFRIAIEEMEAWLLGDLNAIKSTYSNAKINVLDSYVQDSICGTWEKLADAIYPGGATKLKSLGWPHIGQVKCDWAKKIAPVVAPDDNISESFQAFRTGVLNLIGDTC